MSTSPQAARAGRAVRIASGQRTGKGAFRSLLAVALALGLVFAPPASAVTIISQSANTDIMLGIPFAELEFENPLPVPATLQGYDVLEWRDADYKPGPPPFYDDWTVSHPGTIDGNVNEIWMRTQGHSISTSTTVPSSIISIHLVGDNNDGIAQVLVDGIEVARLDMFTAMPETALVMVKGLAGTTHQITVNDLGPSPAGPSYADDVATLGAAALARPSSVKWDQPPAPAQPDNIYNGWNEPSVLDSKQIAADDWVCNTKDPVTDIHWWGSFIGWNKAEPPPDAPNAFRISIWTDVPAGSDKPWSHPRQCIWSIECREFLQNWVGWDYDPRTETFEACFRFDQFLKPEEFFRQNTEEGIYWISIAAIYDQGAVPEHPWGWKTRPRRESPAPDDAVRIFAPTDPLLGSVFEAGEPIFWPTEEQSWDLAFELTSQKLENKAEQRPDPKLPGLHAHDYMGTIGSEFITLADDWVCQGGMVTGFEWWGNYEVDALGNEKRGQGINHFRLSIHNTQSGLPFPLPGAQLAGPIIPFAAASETDTGLVNNEGCKIYHYQITLPQPFPQEQGGQYWFDITAVSNTVQAPALWRWQEARRGPVPTINSPAAQSQNGGPWKTIVWTLQNPPWYSDMAFAVTSGGQGEIYVKWSQPPEPIVPPNVFNGWNEPSIYGWEQIVADDWLCTSDRPVTDVHWWGSFVGWDGKEPPLMPQGFHFGIWTDVPPTPGALPWSHPGKMLWQAECREFRWKFVGWDIDPRNPMAPPEACFYFEQDLRPEEWFWQEPGDNIYWVSISAMYGPEPGPNIPYPWGWKTRPRVDSPAPDDAVRIFIPTAPLPGIGFEQGQPIFWPTEEQSWDTAFRLTSINPGHLDFEPNIHIPNHFWWPKPGNPPNEMLSMWVMASPVEPVFWNSITLQAGGTGNDLTDILAVNVYLDVNNNGIVDAVDIQVGTGAYPADNGVVVINIAPPVLIPAGGQRSVLIAYVMNPAALAAPARTYGFTVVGATGTGQMTGAPVSVGGLPLNSARKIRAPRPIRIGDAKKLTPVGSDVFLEGKLVTADFQTGFGLFYIEEQDRSAGIGVVPNAAAIMPSINIGDKVAVLGTNAFFSMENTEVVIDATDVIVTQAPGTPLKPLKMMSRATGGGVFGLQPAVVDNALSLPRVLSRQLNNVGSYIETWGKVTGVMPAKNCFWIDDGYNLKDGTMLPSGAHNLGVAVLLPPTGATMPALGSFLSVEGILWAVPAGTPGDIYPVRLLVPRSASDIHVHYSPGP